MKTFVYIDGFNVYHLLVNHIKRRKSYKTDEPLKWLDYRKLIENIEPQANIEKMYFFTAPPVHFSLDKQERHKTYMNILNKQSNINVISGVFSQEKEEKQTDVALGVQIVRDWFEHTPQQVFLITNDTDFIPAIKVLLEKKIKKIVVFSPLGTKRLAKSYKELQNKYNNFLTKSITLKNMKDSVYPDIIKVDGKTIRNPYPLPYEIYSKDFKKQ